MKEKKKTFHNFRLDRMIEFYLKKCELLLLMNLHGTFLSFIYDDFVLLL